MHRDHVVCAVWTRQQLRLTESAARHQRGTRTLRPPSRYYRYHPHHQNQTPRQGLQLVRTQMQRGVLIVDRMVPAH